MAAEDSILSDVGLRKKGLALVHVVCAGAIRRSPLEAKSFPRAFAYVNRHHIPPSCPTCLLPLKTGVLAFKNAKGSRTRHLECARKIGMTE
jgi:hypothetical protein